MSTVPRVAATCPKCGESDWYVRPNGRHAECRSCRRNRDNPGADRSGPKAQILALRDPTGSKRIAALTVVTESGCWEWQGHADEHGYGRMRVGGRTTPVHRVSYELVNGPIPEGLFLCHHCDNPPCCNPAHLYPGTPADNIRDMVDRRRAWWQDEHCSNGHPRTTGTTGMTFNTGRQQWHRICLVCRDARRKRRVPCPECGTEVLRNNMAAHISRKHAEVAK